jgi:hypothetical protein
MRGAIPPLPNTPSWRAAQLKSTGTTLSLPLTCVSGLRRFQKFVIQSRRPLQQSLWQSLWIVIRLGVTMTSGFKERTVAMV